MLGVWGASLASPFVAGSTRREIWAQRSRSKMDPRVARAFPTPLSSFHANPHLILQKGHED